LEMEAEPQSSIPQVQMGLRMTLYARSLLLIEIFDLRQYFFFV
jgi:hypothetical protein